MYSTLIRVMVLWVCAYVQTQHIVCIYGVSGGEVSELCLTQSLWLFVLNR